MTSPSGLISVCRSNLNPPTTCDLRHQRQRGRRARPPPGCSCPLALRSPYMGSHEWWAFLLQWLWAAPPFVRGQSWMVPEHPRQDSKAGTGVSLYLFFGVLPPPRFGFLWQPPASPGSQPTCPSPFFLPPWKPDLPSCGRDVGLGAQLCLSHHPPLHSGPHSTLDPTPPWTPLRPGHHSTLGNTS